LIRQLNILIITLAAILAAAAVHAQTNSTDPQVVCIGYIGAYQVDYTENGGVGTIGSNYVWTILTPGFLGTISTNQGPGSSENRVIIDWGATPSGLYQVQIVESNSVRDTSDVMGHSNYR
jgi:hypothetical protein